MLNEGDNAPYEIRKINEELYARYRSFNEMIEHTSLTISNLTHYASFVIYPKGHISMDGTYHMLEEPEFNSLNKAKILLKALDEKDKLLNMMDDYISTGTLNIRIGRENSKE